MPDPRPARRIAPHGRPALQEARAAPRPPADRPRRVATEAGRRPLHWILVPTLRTLAAALVLAAAGTARADTLHIDVQANPERNFTAVQELSYEVIVAGVDGYRADVRLRLALHNATNRPQDTVLSLALPRDAELVGLAVARDGNWQPGRAAGVAVDPGHRASGTVFARMLAPVTDGDLPAAEVVAFNLEPGGTTQVELHLRAPARLRGDRWELELPSRGDDRWGLAAERRVVVQDPGHRPRFWLDGGANAGAPYLASRPEDRSIVAWPYNPVAKDRRVLDGRLEVLPDPAPPGKRAAGGRFRVYLRLGAGAPPRPDHVVVVLDRSRSTAPDLHRDAIATVSALFDELPAEVTFDALSFARHARPLLGEGEFPGVRDRAARDRVAAALDAGAREQGTDLAAALALAGRRIAARGAHRPLLLVITDGMLPVGVGPQQIDQALQGGLGKRAAATRPELLFVVDEPMMQRGGISADHPIAGVAAALRARISLESLAQHGPGGGESSGELTDALLAAPGVLADLSLELPRRATLDAPPPTGLVAGNFVVVRGRYTGAPPAVTVRGKLGGARTAHTLRAAATPPPPAAFVASVAVAPDLARAASDGFSLPPWFGRKLQRIAQLGITWAGRGNGDERGYLDEKIFRTYLGTRVFPRARVCFNKALARNQTLGGRVVFELEVGKGEVMHAKVDTAGINEREATFEACLLEAAWALEIPAGRLDDQVYRVRYPVVFNPPAGGRPSMEDDPLGPGTVELLLKLPR